MASTQLMDAEQVEEVLRQKTAQLRLLERIAVAANEATSVEVALKMCLDAVCAFARWPVGHVYFIADDDPDVLRPSTLWHFDDPGQFETFRQVTEATPLGRGNDLAGMVLASGKPQWIRDVSPHTNFPRNKLARTLDLKAAFGFPVFVGKEIPAVLEFFSTEVLEPDTALLDIMAHVGTQLGRVIERDRAQKALRQSQEHSRLIIETANDAFVGITPDGRITDWNKQATITFGWPPEETIGRLLAETIIPPKYRAAHKKGLEHFLATGEGPVLYQRIELEALHHDGHIFPVELTIWPLKSGQTYRLYAFVHDITERKRVEAELRLLNATLEQRVAERTAAVEHHARVLARSNADLEQFAYVASHDLQEPLRMVSTFVQLLARRYQDLVDAEGQEFIHYAVDGALRMRTLIDDLLTYSRVTSQAKGLEATDSLHAFQRVVANLQIAIQESGAEVTHGPLPTVMADSTQLGQLLQNLLGNAIKFRRPQEPPRVHVEAEAKNDEWLFSVRDNGIGIKPVYQDRIFKIFKRLHAQKEYPGTGLGLAICKKIVERHGGRIWVESQGGQGSVFYFTLPRKPGGA